MFLRVCGKALLFGAALAMWLWCLGAIWHSGLGGPVLRGVISAVFGIGFPVAWFGVKKRRAVAPVFGAAALSIVVLWQFKEPANERDWSPDMAVMPYGVFEGDLAHIKNIRNSDYTSTEEFTVDYYDRTFDLRELRSAYFLVEPVSEILEGVAHTLVTFGFEGDRYVAISIELRREKGEHFSPVAGIYKAYELMYVIGDERDLIRLRTNYRKDKVYLYPITAPQEMLRALFTEMVERANGLRTAPEFYHTFFSSCTTNIVDHVNAIVPGHVPWSWRIFLPGYSGRLAYDLGLIETDLSFEETQVKCRIDERAREIGDDERFSVLIRGRG